MRKILVAALVLASAIAIAPSRPAAAASPQNIVLILTDDQRFDSLQYMPNVQSMLASKGVTFSNAFDNNPLCCPSRTTILTGLTSGHNGVWTNANGPDGGFAGFKANGDDQRQVLGWINDAGYSTALVGKFLNRYTLADRAWVMQGVDDWQAFLLDRLGHTGCERGGYMGTCYSNNGNLEVPPPSSYSTTTSGDKATSFIANADPAKPLFLWYAPRAPHLPITPDVPYEHACQSVTPLRAPSYNRLIIKAPAYMAALKALSAKTQNRLDGNWVDSCRTLLSVDDQVGNIVQALRDTGRLDNTLILFASDNGFVFGEHRWTGKIVPYEESVRVPVVIRADSVIPEALQGSTSTEIITNLDYTPTFLEAAGLSQNLDGQSLYPLIGGGGSWASEDTILIEHGNGAGQTNLKVPSYCGVRQTGWLYAQYTTGEEELYDLSADPYEQTNVASDDAYVTERAFLRAQTHVLCDPVPPGFTFAH